MQIRFTFGIIFLFLSCKEPQVLPPQSVETPVGVEVDTAPPKINWMSPRFDAMVNKIVIINCQIIDTSGVDRINLYIDSLQSDIIATELPDSIFEFLWHTLSYSDSSKHYLSIFSADSKGNDTITQYIRVIVNNNNTYPAPVTLKAIDSLFIDDIYTGFKLDWSQSDDRFFRQYIVRRSTSPLMENSAEVLIEDRFITDYEDNPDTGSNVWYYQIIVENQINHKSPGNILSTTINEIPPIWNINSVLYNTAGMLTISWDTLEYSDYLFHKIMVSDNRDGKFSTLDSISDNSAIQYQTNSFNPSYLNNWFAVATGDSMGQISISQPSMHPPPQDPVIDSVLYSDQTFTLHWSTEPENDFSQYQILHTEDEDPYNLFEAAIIDIRTDTTVVVSNVIESEYYLYQIITKDAWSLETRGPVLTVSSFYKFSTIVDGGARDNLFSVIATDAGGYMAVGESTDGGSWLVQMNGLGEISENINYGDSNSGFRCIAHAPNGGFLLCGFTRTVEDMDNLLVFKADDSGNLIWDKNFGYDYNDRGNAIVSLSDGGIGVTGYSHINPGNQDLFVMKIGEDGNEKWSKTVGGEKSDEGHDILPLDGGGMIVLGETHSQGDLDGDIWLLEFDSDGNIVDTVLIENEGLQIGYSFVKSELGGYTIGGVVSGGSGVTDALMIRMNGTGEVEWTFQYGGVNNDAGYSIIYSDGGWILAGQTYNKTSGQGDVWLLKVSDFGELEWEQVYGSIYDDKAADIYLAQDMGFIICGSTYSQEKQTDGWLIKTDSRGNYRGIVGYP